MLKCNFDVVWRNKWFILSSFVSGLDLRKRAANQSFPTIFECVRPNGEFISSQRNWASAIRGHLEANGVYSHVQFRQSANEHCIHWFRQVIV